ncbi:membrane lipoprotein lipid attachment site-containing protein [Novosphingobium sp. SG707]|uniref:membrane lipoprotein lipid attachment site-containing protein n=1 Tax=Novosphingobium sp. SG707 TaxID=2586996 RepID=UPI001447A0EB|nr:membrane lipoprotein lipid attachment site-containing protein [Novosphingobium sp. SG707]NKJ02676.1 hypothetical protein [Novosphingobium sp. SG707]
MKRLIFAALSAFVLTGCTGTHIKSPPVCDGKHRRPANLYGSILPSLPVPVPPSQSSGQSLVAPAASEPPVSAPTTAPSAKKGAMNTRPPAPRTSMRDVARSYSQC